MRLGRGFGYTSAHLRQSDVMFCWWLKVWVFMEDFRLGAGFTVPRLIADQAFGATRFSAKALTCARAPAVSPFS